MKNDRQHKLNHENAVLKVEQDGKFFSLFGPKQKPKLFEIYEKKKYLSLK